MSIIKSDPHKLIIASSNLPNLPKPFERDIFLFTTHIAGTTHTDNIDDIIKKLQEDEQFHFFREIDNQYDNHAIIIKNKNKERIGYVPSIDNVVISRLMDAGKLIFGKLKNIETKGKWQKINIDIYLKD